jgi:hypothetical protein
MSPRLDYSEGVSQHSVEQNRAYYSARRNNKGISEKQREIKYIPHIGDFIEIKIAGKKSEFAGVQFARRFETRKKQPKKGRKRKHRRRGYRKQNNGIKQPVFSFLIIGII